MFDCLASWRWDGPCHRIVIQKENGMCDIGNHYYLDDRSLSFSLSLCHGLFERILLSFPVQYSVRYCSQSRYSINQINRVWRMPPPPGRLSQHQFTLKDGAYVQIHRKWKSIIRIELFSTCMKHVYIEAIYNVNSKGVHFQWNKSSSLMLSEGTKQTSFLGGNQT